MSNSKQKIQRQRQIRIHIEDPSDEFDQDMNTTTTDIEPISNRNMIQKIESMTSLDEYQINEYKKSNKKQKNITRTINKNVIKNKFNRYLSRRWKKQVSEFLNHGVIQVFILTITTWAILGMIFVLFGCLLW